MQSIQETAQGIMMNAAQRRAIEVYIANRYDDLVRFKMRRENYPYWKSGNDEPIDSIIANLEKEIAELKEGLR